MKLIFFKSDKFSIFCFFLTFEAYYIFMASQKSLVHTHTHLNNIKRGKILYSNKELWKESLVPNLHCLALKLQLYQGNFLPIKREKATLFLSLSLSLSLSFLCRHFTTSSKQKRKVSVYILLRGIILTSEAYHSRWSNHIGTSLLLNFSLQLVSKQ